MRIIIYGAVLAMLVGCAASAKKMNRLSVGITKSEAIRLLGTPKTTTASQGIEYLIYVLDASRADPIWPEDYFVRIVGGKVDSFGRVRDLPRQELPK